MFTLFSKSSLNVQQNDFLFPLQGPPGSAAGQMPMPNSMEPRPGNLKKMHNLYFFDTYKLRETQYLTLITFRNITSTSCLTKPW